GEDEAIKVAINEVSRQQTNYARANWPVWMQNPWLNSFMMFKQFGITQAIQFYESLAKSIKGVDRETQRMAITHLVGMSLVMAAVGGMSGNPLWEPARMFLWVAYLLGLTDDGNWDNWKTKGEKMMAEIENALFGPSTGGRISESIMYGLPRLFGIDVSRRVALDTLLTFQQPEDMTRDEWYKIVGQVALGAPGAVAFDTIAWAAGAVRGEGSWAKWMSQAPIPKIAKDIFKTYDAAQNGVTTTTGVRVGDPPGILEGLTQSMLGLRTRGQARPFEQGSAAQRRLKTVMKTQRDRLVRNVVNNGYTAANMRAINNWNETHRDKAERIILKTLREAGKRRRGLEREIEQQNVE